MKKVSFLAMIILLLISCATATIPVKPISQDDLNDLKGEWTGRRYSQAAVNRTDLKIHNNTLPLSGEVIFYWKGKGEKIWFFNNGQIENGRLIIVWKQRDSSLDLRLRKGDGKMELEGNYRAKAFSAAINFQKVSK